MKPIVFYGLLSLGALAFTGCAAKIVGDPKKPIVIEAHVTIDIHGLKNTANDIENMVDQPVSKKA